MVISQNGDETEMAIYTADLKWTASEGEDFLKGRFSRAHTLSFDGGTVVPASASPHVVGKWAAEAAVDPEEMFVAALSSCHMLSLLQWRGLPDLPSRPTTIMRKASWRRSRLDGRRCPRSLSIRESRGRAPLRAKRSSSAYTTRLTKSASLPIR